MKTETIVIDSRKKLAAYLKELASKSLVRECKIDELEELLSTAVGTCGERMPKSWLAKAKRALANR